MKDLFFLSLSRLKNRKLRSWLTIIGIVIGVAAVVALYSLGKGMEVSITEEFKRIGTDKLVVSVKSPLGPFSDIVEAKLTPADADQVRKVRGVSTVAEVAVGFVNTEFKDDFHDLIIRGVNFNTEEFSIMQEVLDLEIAQGRLLKPGEKGKVVVGAGLAKKNGEFEKKVRLGDKVSVLGNDFKVVGILESKGRPEVDNSLLFDVEEARLTIFSEPKKTDIIAVRLDDKVSIDGAKSRVKAKLRSFRDVRKQEEDFEVQTFESAFETFFAIINIVTSVVLAITIVSLIVGGVGITNTMYTSVLERRKEIGIMKAIGAKNRDVISLFLIESAFLGVVGGFIGLVLGVFIALIVGRVASTAFNLAFINPVFPPSLFIGVFGFTFLIGLLSGTYPAYRATKVRPVEAIRG